MAEAAPADFQWRAAVTQDRVHMAFRRAPQFGDFVTRHQTIAMDANKALGKLGFQRLQRLFDQIFAARVVHDHIFFIGLHEADIVNRDHPQTATQARAQLAACARLVAMHIAASGQIGAHFVQAPV